MDCPHASHQPGGTAVICAVLGMRVAGPANPNYPCDRCRSEWTDDTPPDPDDPKTWTPTLLSFAEPFGMLAKPLPAPCFHLGPVLVPSCCTRKRVHACEDPDASGRDKTTIPLCQACDAYDAE